MDIFGLAVALEQADMYFTTWCAEADTEYPLFVMNTLRYLYGTKRQPGNWLKSIRPFPPSVWLAVLSSLVAMVVFFLITRRVYIGLP